MSTDRARWMRSLGETMFFRVSGSISGPSVGVKVRRRVLNWDATEHTEDKGILSRQLEIAVKSLEEGIAAAIDDAVAAGIRGDVEMCAEFSIFPL